MNYETQVKIRWLTAMLVLLAIELVSFQYIGLPLVGEMIALLARRQYVVLVVGIGISVTAGVIIVVAAKPWVERLVNERIEPWILGL